MSDVTPKPGIDKWDTARRLIRSHNKDAAEALSMFYCHDEGNDAGCGCRACTVAEAMYHVVHERDELRKRVAELEGRAK